MKKLFLLLSFLWMFTFIGNGQTITIGSGTTTTSYLPIYSCYNYSYTQQIYTQTQIGTPGTIDRIRFYYSSGTNTNSLNWTVYMGHTTKTAFASTSDWVALANLTQVFSGNVTYPAAGNWMEITLSTPFVYNNTDNLVIAVDENTSGYNCSVYWRSFTSGSNTGIYYRSDDINPDPAAPPTANLRTGTLAQVQLAFQEACSSPNGLTASNITTTSATIGWNAPANAPGSGYQWELRTSGAGGDPTPDFNGSTAAGVISANVVGLSSATTYNLYVRSDCGAGSFSSWAGPYPFTTAASPINTFPYAESFESTTFPPAGWTNVKTAGTGTPGIWDRQTAGTFPTCTPQDGAAMIRYNCFSLSSGTKGELTSRAIDFPAGNYKVSFWMYRDVSYASTADLVNVYYNSTPGSAGGTLLGTINRSTTLAPAVAAEGWYEYEFQVPNEAGIRYISFEGVSAYGGNIFLDNIIIGEVPTTTLSWFNLQWPPDATIAMNEQVTVYAQCWEDGVTNMDGPGVGIEAWIGYSTENTNPDTWTNWVPAAYNVDAGNNDEYMADLGMPQGLAQGTYYYASRFRYQNGPFTYGGYQGGPWDGTANVSGVLTVTACNPTGFPYTENFDGTWGGTPAAPTCWTVINADDDAYTWSQGNTYITPTPSLPYAAHGMGNQDDWLISPAIDLTGAPARVLWKDKVESASYPNKYKVFISTTSPDIASFTTELGDYNCTNTAWTEHVINLDAYQGQTVYIAFWQYYSQATFYGFGIDDFSIDLMPPPCPVPPAQPTALLLNSTSTAVNGEYTASAATGYVVVRHTAATLGGTPTNGTVYNAGDAIGNGTVVYRGTGTSFSSTGLDPSKTYYFFVFAYNSEATCTGPTYRTTAPLTGSIMTKPGAPEAFTANAVGSNAVSFNVTPNAQGHNIIVAWNTTNVFGDPMGAYNVGAQITGGGTVHYVGSATGLYNQTGLTPGSTYYYRVWSVVAGPMYSSNFVNANATTFFEVPYVQNFDNSLTGTTPPTGWTSHASAASRPWTITTTLPNVSAPNAIGIFYSSTSPKNEYLVTPGLMLTGGQPYLVRFQLEAPGWAGTPEDLRLLVAGSPSLEAISNGQVLWDLNGTTVPAYTEYIINYTPPATGAYFFGWHAYSIADLDYIVMDNVTVIEQPAFQSFPESHEFDPTFAGLQSMPQTFTFQNNRNTSITVNSVSLNGNQIADFMLQDANTYPKVVGPGATMQVDVVFAPGTAGEKETSIKVSENNGDHFIPLMGTGFVQAPMSLTGTAVPVSSIQLNWNEPLPDNEIRYDDNTAENWMWVADPSTLDQMFSTRITITQAGSLTHFSVLSRTNDASTFNQIMLCPIKNGSPDLDNPVETFNNVPVSSLSGQWLLFELTTPESVEAGDEYFIVTNWPDASTVGPFVGTDMGMSFGRSSWTNNGGTTWNAFSGNFMMRAYMTLPGKAAPLTLTFGEEIGQLASLPIVQLHKKAEPNDLSINQTMEGIEVPAVIINGSTGKAPSSYTLRRGTESGNYTYEVEGLSGTSYLDETTAGASFYYYQLAAIYPNGEGLSNEIMVQTLCTPFDLPYVQSFDANMTPVCWEQTFEGALTSNRWAPSNTSLAGGTAYEMKATFQNSTGISRLISPAFNTAGETQVTVAFKHYFDDYGAGIDYKIQSSADGINWTDEAWGGTSGNGNVGPETVYANILSNVGDVTYIAWVLDGNHFQFDYWYIDDVTVSTSMSVEYESQNVSCFGANDGSIELSIIGGVPPYTISWTGPDGFTSDQTMITELAAGTYNYSVLDSQGIFASDMVTLTQPDEVAAPEIGDTEFVYDGTVQTVEAIAPAGTELIWYDAPEGGEVIEAPMASDAGIYPAWVAAFDALVGCESTRIDATMTIDPRELTVTADDQSKCQNTENPELSLTYEGFAAGEDVENLETAPLASTTATLNSLPGEYPITVGGGISNNYAFNYENGTLTVIASPIVDAGDDGSVCVNEAFPIVDATASNFTTVLWSSSGNGSFSDANEVNPIYTPGSADITNGFVTLTLTGDPGSPCSMSDDMVLTIQNDLPVSVTISLNTPEICNGTLVSFSAMPVNGGLAPSYQWKVNGANAGTDSPNFEYVPADGDVVTVVLTSSIGCALNNPATSNAITVNVTPDLTAEVSIDADATEVCDFTPVTFTAYPVNGGMNPSYQWLVNGEAAGTNSATFTYAPLDGDAVSVVMTSSHLCAVVPVATSNVITMSVAPPLLVLIPSPANGGTVSGGGNYADGSVVTVTATPSSGWEFLNWRNMDGEIVSTNATFDYTINLCYDELVATFSSTARIAGQLKYFNALETTIPSAGNNIQFYVQLFENGLPHSERQLVKYNATQGLDSYFEFIGAESGKDYTLKIYEQPTSNLLGNTWAWNNWGGASSVDALIISYMSVGNPVVSSYPWILPEGASDYTALFSNVADVTGDGNILGSDPLALMFRTIGLPGYSPFPGGTHNFQLATTKLAAHAEKAHPAAPEVLFAQNGTYTAASPASSVYYEAELTNLNDGLNVFNVYFVATGDMNTSYVPGTAAKASVNLGFDNIIAANVGDEILIPVVINQAAELGAVSLGLSYNTDLIEVVDVLGYDIVNIDAEAGTVRIAWMDQLGKAYGSGQEILVLKAKVLTDIQAGTAYMSLMSDTELGDRQANVLHDISLSTSYIETGVTGIDNLSDLKLNHRIFPNPFNDATQIQYTLPVAGKVRVDVYNHLGQLVITLADELQQAGAHKLLLNNYDLNGAGSYFYQISVSAEGQSFTERGTIVLTK